MNNEIAFVEFMTRDKWSTSHDSNDIINADEKNVLHTTPSRHKNKNIQQGVGLKYLFK